MSTESLSAAPGWYPDGFGSIRFFDGTAWTDHTQQPPPVAQPPAAPPAAAADEAVPFYREGWFIVDVLVLAGIALLIAVAAIT